MSRKSEEKLREAHGRFSAHDLAGAERLCGEVLAKEPRNAGALHLLGVLRLMGGNAREAASFLGEAVQSNPLNPMALENLGVAHLACGDAARAETVLRQAMALGASHASLEMRLGMALTSQRRLAEAVAALSSAASKAPQDPDVHLNLGNALAEDGKGEEALACYRKVLALQPEHVVAHFNIGTQLKRMGRLGEAEAAYRAAFAFAPDHADAHHNLGTVYEQQGRPDEAAECYRKTLAANAAHVQALNSLGTALRAQGRVEEAIGCYERALASDPKHLDAYINLGNVRAEQGRYPEAAELYDKALSLNSQSFEAHYNLGKILKQQGDTGAAIEHYRCALALGANQGDAFNELGSAYREAGNFEEAITSYRQAIAAVPSHVRALYNLAETLKIEGRLDEAAALDERALSLDPDHLPALGALVHLRQHMCSWDGIGPMWERLRREAIGRTGSGITPFSTLSWATTPAEQLACARAWAHDELSKAAAARTPLAFDFSARRPRERLGIGYLSAGFRRHALSHLTAELFELHDRERFEIIAYSCAPDDGSAVRERIRQACERFVDVTHESFVATAQRIRRDEVDILVDLDGWTLGARTRTLALRPAPIQVNWLGYPGTMGADGVDYIIADPFIIPPELERYYAEKVMRLPDCYQITDRRRDVSERMSTREEYGLPAEGFVFCCFNQPYKILPDVFALWMRILDAVPGSVLWLAESNRWHADNLRRAATAAGLAAERVMFASRKPLPEYLVQYRLADLALDTFPYTSHTTASDALWLGCPLVTCAGETFASRVAGSILVNAGLPELVTQSFAQYERLVLELASRPEKLQNLRRKLRDNRDTCALFDTPQFVTNLERAYEEMFDLYARGGVHKNGV